MKKLAFGALLGLLAACGGGGGSGDDGPDLIDASSGPDAAEACNPVAQTGCATGEKCTWVNIDSANDLGVVKCVPDGTVEEGGNCTMGADGEDTGYDDCVAGTYCIGYSASQNRPGACEAICTLSPDSCPAAESACSRYAGVFEGAELGVCDFKCSPGTQRRVFDDAAACGSPDANAPIRGCYGIFREYTCSPAISTTVHGEFPMPVPPGQTPGQGAYLNSCAPGYQVFQLAEGTEVDLYCVAMCQPQEVHSGVANPQTAKLGVAPYRLTDRNVNDAAFECRYLWFMQAIFQETAYISTELNDSGIAFNPSAWLYNDDQNEQTPDVPFPSCTTLTNALVDTDNDGTPDTPDHESWGCAPLPESFQGRGYRNVRVNGVSIPDQIQSRAN